MKNFKRLTNIFIFFLLFANPIVSKTQTKVSDSIYKLAAGTKIRVKMDNEINSRVSSVNDTFTVTISAPVVVREVEVLAVDTVIEGKILGVNPAGAGRKNGSMEVKFLTLRLPNNIKRSIDASLVNTIKPPKTSSFIDAVTIVGGTAAGALFGSVADKSKGALIGAGVGAGIGSTTVLLKKGRDVSVKANEEFEIQLNQDVNLPAEDY